MTDSEKKVFDDIEKYGVHVIYIMEDEQGPGFGFSIGLYETYNHPEIIMVGLKHDITHSLINSIADTIKKGSVFTPNQFYPGITEGFDCYFLEVEEAFYRDYLGYANWYYKNINFPVLQCVYPTTKGVYPWEKDWPESLNKLQLLLGQPNI